MKVSIQETQNWKDMGPDEVVALSRTILPPRVPSSIPGRIKHVRCDGARFHVLSWHIARGVFVRRCSDPDCVFNATQEELGNNR